MVETEAESPTPSPMPALRATAIPDEVLFAQFRLDPEHLDEAEADFARLCYRAALDHVGSAYGIDPEYADEHESIAIAVLAHAPDNYDNPTADASGSAANRTLEAILSAHDFNLI